MKVPRLVVACAAVALLAPATASAATQEEIDQSVAAGAAWIRTQQNVATGQLSGFGGDYALSALAAAGVHAADAGTPSAQDYYAGLWSAQAAPSSTAVLFGHAAGIDVQRLSESTNLVAQLATAYNPDGSFGNGATNVAAFTALALARVGAPAGVLAKVNGYLRGQQHLDGGWSFGRVTTDAQRATAGSVDMTGAVLAALCESGAAAGDADVRAGLSFLEGRQDPATGGFGNVDSTGWALSGLNACGVAAQGGRFTTLASLTPVDHLLSQQEASGAFLFAGAPNLYSTQNAVRALAGEAFTADPPRRATASDPRFRAVAAVADGTPTPHVLAVDHGAGDVRLCSVTAPAGASLATLVGAAPCVTSFVAAGGIVTEIDGHRGDWRLRLNRTPEQPAAEARAIAFGDMVGLRTSATVAGPQGSPGPAGQPGAPGATGPRGPRARVTCKVRSRRRVTCRVKSGSIAKLVRHGRTYASGTAKRLHARRSLRPGRYTLVVEGARLPVTLR